MRPIVTMLTAVMLVTVPAYGALAQPVIQFGPPAGAPGDAPPVAVGPGWRYERRGADVHMFLCQQESCNRSSRVSYRLYAPDPSLTLDRFRREQEAAVEVLEQRGPPGVRITILSVEGGDGGMPRMYKSKRLMTFPDGRKEFVISSVVLGSRGSASLISSSLDEKASDGNHAIFGIAVMLLVNVEPKR